MCKVEPGSCCLECKTDLDKYRNRIKTLEEHLAQNRTEYGHPRAAYGMIEGSVDRLTQERDAALGRLKDVENNISNMKYETEKEGEPGLLECKVDGLENEVDDLRQQFQSLVGMVEDKLCEPPAITAREGTKEEKIVWRLRKRAETYTHLGRKGAVDLLNEAADLIEELDKSARSNHEVLYLAGKPCTVGEVSKYIEGLRQDLYTHLKARDVARTNLQMVIGELRAHLDSCDCSDGRKACAEFVRSIEVLNNIAFRGDAAWTQKNNPES